MSLVTRCPACDTTFKVVRDQLRISDGWVRCGRCSQVFDATIDLQETPPASSSPAVAAPEPGEPPPHTDPEPPAATAAETADAPAEAIAETDFFDDEQASGPAPLAPSDGFLAPRPMSWPDADSLLLGDQGRTAVRPPVPPPLAFPDIDLTLPSRPATLASAVTPPEADDSGHMQLEKALRRARIKSAKIARAKAKEQAAAAAVAEVAPVVQAASEPEPAAGRADAASATALDAEPLPAFLGIDEAPIGWRRPAVRRSLVVAAVLAALLLLAQVLHQERDLIAARQPALRPLLDGLCRVTGCTLTALRQINDIKIDGASFARDKEGDGFHLGFTVRNSATLPLAMPAVELSLLDTQERAVVRRVLMPSDFGAPAVLPAHAERSASLALRLSGDEAASMPPVAGFRLEALYP
ncbi:zinc-ribbon and DUF3426 domain-containing protein [Variovorax sp. J31P179]|uniref:zinc-ribbon and DUF3426 domain-containing protein n=1 Tax=Variovorax sp. J31P179 TaxID=3053508 RepID=UPI002577ED99|nr:zinc-ribbon and DUF3426 domain-containing protein [Variovorax sp. J31P179]MDM0081774.1 zinc-ribbon and DUF3426 domain-containing protein [Variovorax sp. J31P179]